jgi:hypothetical protein
VRQPEDIAKERQSETQNKYPPDKVEAKVSKAASPVTGQDIDSAGVQTYNDSGQDHANDKQNDSKP